MKTLTFLSLVILLSCSRDKSSARAKYAHVEIIALDQEGLKASVGSESNPKLYRVENRGTLDVLNLQITLGSDFQFSGGKYPGENGTCTSLLHKKKSCSLEVVFVPSRLGLIQEEMSLVYVSQVGPSSKLSTLIGQSSQNLSLSWSDDSPSVFPETFIDGQSTVTLKLRNESTSPVSTLYWEGPNHADIAVESTSCTSDLSATSECDFVLRFSPESRLAEKFKFEISYLDGSGQTEKLVKYLEVKSKTAGQLVVKNLVDIDFGGNFVGEDASFQIVEIENTGDSEVFNIQSRLAPPFELEEALVNPCPEIVESGLKCNLLISFTPLLKGDYLQNQLVEYNNDLGLQILNIPIRASTLAEGELAFSRTAFHFGGKVISYSRVMTLRLNNIGDRPVTGLSVTSPTSFHFKKDETSCILVIGGGSSCEVSFSFTPGVDGNFTDSVTVSYVINGVSNTRVIQLTGSGYAQNSTGPTSFAFFTTQEAADEAVDAPSGNIDIGRISFPLGNTITLYIKNMGNYLGKIISNDSVGGTISASYVGGIFPGTAGTCSLTHFMTPDEICSIVMLATPYEWAASRIGRTTSFSTSFNWWSGGAIASEYKNFEALSYSSPLSFNKNLSDFGILNLSIAPSLSETITITNMTEIAIESLNVSLPAYAYYFSGGAFPGTDGNCGFPINPGDSCEIVIEYRPENIGSHQFNLTIEIMGVGLNHTTVYPLNGSAVSEGG